MTEKLDGIRAIWTGKQLITNNGRIISTIPQYLLDELPKDQILMENYGLNKFYFILFYFFIFQKLILIFLIG